MTPKTIIVLGHWKVLRDGRRIWVAPHTKAPK